MATITSLYTSRYRYIYTFEYFAYLLEKGYAILQSGKMNSSTNTIEQRALHLALEYNMYAMVEC